MKRLFKHSVEAQFLNFSLQAQVAAEKKHGTLGGQRSIKQSIKDCTKIKLIPNDVGRNERGMRNNEFIWPKGLMLLMQEGHNLSS